MSHLTGNDCFGKESNSRDEHRDLCDYRDEPIENNEHINVIITETLKN